jgi:dCMP deaminase
MIVGVMGENGAGKDTAAAFFETKGFTHISLPNLLRQELKENRKQEVTTPALVELGNEMAETYGAGVLAFLALEQMEKYRKYVVTSIRRPAEAALLKRKNALLIFLDTTPQTRYARLKERNRQGDQLMTFEEFLAFEQRQHSALPHEQQQHKMRAIANLTIDNNGTPEQLYDQLNAVLASWQPKLHHRPSWDEFFIEMANLAGNRGTCDRGKAGSVIVKDKRLLSMGYVGAPAGLPHCDEVGHEMQSVENSDGTKSLHCVRTTHAEQNAIANAARYGTNINGATIYVKMEPCYTCAKIIVNSGIKRVVAQFGYHKAERSRAIFKEAGVELVVLNNQAIAYHGQKA